MSCLITVTQFLLMSTVGVTDILNTPGLCDYYALNHESRDDAEVCNSHTPLTEV